MRKSHFTLPSPAMVVALTALFVALGGTGYAASQLGHSQGTAGKKGGNDNTSDTTLVKALAPSLSVKHATTATAATAASSVDGLQARKIDFVRARADGQNHQILNLDGLVLIANCTNSDLFVTAYTTVGGAEVNAAIQTNQGRLSRTDSNGDFYDQGDTYNASSDLPKSTGLDVVDYPGTAGESVNVHLEYANTRQQVVSVNFMSNQDAMSSNVACLVTGTATGG